MVKVELRCRVIQEVKEGPHNNGRTMCGCQERESTCVLFKRGECLFKRVCERECVCLCVHLKFLIYVCVCVHVSM